MKRFIQIIVIASLCTGCATSPSTTVNQNEVLTANSYTGTAWEECCWNDIGLVIIRNPRRRIRVNIWINSWWSNRGR